MQSLKISTDTGRIHMLRICEIEDCHVSEYFEHEIKTKHAEKEKRKRSMKQ
jgi:hypothetical protein